MSVTVGGVAAPELSWGQWVAGIQGPNERVIELPLAFEAMALWRPGRVLDAGCSCNAVLDQPPVADLVHVTHNLASEPQFEQPRRAYVAADLRDLSRWPDRFFDRVVCISTLEHVGMDNSAYDGPVEQNPDSVVNAVAELWRVCKETLLITVPFRLEPWACEAWRYFTPQTIPQLVPATASMDPHYYVKHEDGWAGPHRFPQVPFETDPKPVRQILALKLWR